MPVLSYGTKTTPKKPIYSKLFQKVKWERQSAGSADISGLEVVFGSKQHKYMYVLTVNLTDTPVEFLKCFLFVFLQLELMYTLSHNVRKKSD